MNQTVKNEDSLYEGVDYETHNIYNGIDEDLYRQVVAKLNCDKNTIVRKDQDFVETMEGDRVDDGGVYDGGVYYGLSTEIWIVIVIVAILLIYIIYTTYNNSRFSREDIYRILHL